MTRRERAGTLLAVVLAVLTTGYSAWKLIGTGMLSWHIRQPETAAMLVELAAVWLLFFLLFFLGKSGRWRAVGAAVLVGVFSWMHAVFLPVLLTGVYVGYLVLAGRFFGRAALKKDLSVTWAFLMGCAGTITVFCLLSLLQQGSIAKLRLWVAASGVLLALWCVAGRRRGENRGGVSARSSAAGLPPVMSVMLAAVFTLLILQMSRMNIAVDFDSLWYGVRSHVMLDSQTGIYENLGTLGVVYTYPKGWETLTLPLAGLPSYSFPIAFNFWTAGMVLLAAYETARVSLEPKRAVWAPVLMAAVPGIMNMACTAKADLMTLFFQILMIQSVLKYEKDRESGWLVLGLAAGGISLTMKPTAVIYSTAIAGIAVLWILWNHFLQHRTPVGEHPRIWLALLPCAAALVGIWGRTLYLVGVPVTSVFYQIFQKIGFHVKYPFYASGFPAAGGGMSPAEKLRFFFGRLWGVLFNPQGDDMAHVVIAWGTALPFIFLILWLGMRWVRGKEAHGKERDGGAVGGPGFLSVLTAAVGFINLVSLYALSQIDGNYYMLFYALVILAGCIWLGHSPKITRRAAGLALVPAWALAALLCVLTNWAWALGNGGIHLQNDGYYNHIQEARRERAAQGSQAIWDILAADPKTKAIALGEHPGVLTFPCSVQSYVDVSGYWGNPDVVSDAPHFLEYLQYADTDYLYMEKEYVDSSVRIYRIVRELVADGWLGDVREENGNLILSVQKDGPRPEAVPANLDVFDHRYVQHP